MMNPLENKNNIDLAISMFRIYLPDLIILDSLARDNIT